MLIHKLSVISQVGLTIECCGCILWKVNGLPCSYMIEDFKLTYGYIPLSIIDSFWKQLTCAPSTLHHSTLGFLELSKIKALQNRYETTPANERVVLQSELKVLAFLSTTKILKPSVVAIRKGRPSAKQGKKDKSTKRDPSYFEHIKASVMQF